MLRACVIDFQGGWSQHLLMAEFAYNNSYQASIKMAPFEALYGRKCRSPLHWSEVGERLALGPDVLREAEDKFALLGSDFGPVAYRLALPPNLSGVHNVFHVSVLRRYIHDPAHVLEAVPVELCEDLSFEEQPVKILAREVKKLRNRDIPYVKVLWSNHGSGRPPHVLEAVPVELCEDLSFEEQPVKILAREVKKLRNRDIPYVKVLWSNHGEREATWELESALQERYPYLFQMEA
uniref:Tf2-1-like SH3-like domain-containing protein n=1 Tax=Ananas comosus var. bracteatus TaxID=296719 RepID=A0A6V7QBD2_ANACO|nr:unnamed protein product [Ananas comosus var. bracteatus]